MAACADSPTDKGRYVKPRRAAGAAMADRANDGTPCMGRKERRSSRRTLSTRRRSGVLWSPGRRVVPFLLRQARPSRGARLATPARPSTSRWAGVLNRASAPPQYHRG